MAGKSYQVLSTSEAKALLDELHQNISEFNNRVFITRKDSRQRCVLISEAELQGLERAVEILSETHDAAALRDEVLRIAAAASSVPLVPSLH